MLHLIYGSKSDRLPAGPYQHITNLSAFLLAISEPLVPSSASPDFSTIPKRIPRGPYTSRYASLFYGSLRNKKERL